MKCMDCENNKQFTMVKEVAYWNDEKKEFVWDKDSQGDEYYTCDMCGSGKIDTEGDY